MQKDLRGSPTADSLRLVAPEAAALPRSFWGHNGLGVTTTCELTMLEE